MIKKLIKSGLKQEFLQGMKKKDINNEYHKIFGLRKVFHYKPVLHQVPPYFDENKTTTFWPHRSEKIVDRSKINYSIRVLNKNGISMLVKSQSIYRGNGENPLYEYKREFVPLSFNIINKNFSSFISYKVNTVTSKIRETLPIKPSRTAKFIGFTPFVVGSRPQRVRAPDRDTLDFLNNPITLKEFPELVNFKRNYAVEISWISQIKEFQALCDPNVQGEVFTSKELLNSVSNNLHRIFLPKLDKPDPLGCLSVKTNGNAYAGKLSELYFEKSNHSYVDKYIKPIAVEFNEMIMTNLVPDKSIWTIGGRVRFMGDDKIEDDLRCRVLIMPEGVNKIVGLNTIQPFYERLVELQKFHPNNEICLGTSFLEGNFFNFDDVNRQFDNVIEADLKRYDQSATEPQIVAAFGILRSCYPEGDDIDLLFLHHCAAFLFKNIVTPGGFIYRVSKGIATGSPFTSAIGSILNWMNWSRVADELGIENRQIRVYGDDTLLFFNGFMHLEHDHLPHLVRALTGFTTDPLIIKRVNDPPSIERAYVFLKTYSFHGFPCKHFDDTALRILYPEFSSKDRCERIDSLNSAFYVSPFNDRAMQFLNYFRFFLNKKKILSFPTDSLRSFYHSILYDKSYDIIRDQGVLLHLKTLASNEQSQFKHVWELRRKGSRFLSTKGKFQHIDRSILSESYGLPVNYYKINYDFYKFQIVRNKDRKKPIIKRNLYNRIYSHLSYGNSPIDNLGIEKINDLKWYVDIN